ncbi:MAG TPA: DinB family protein [Bryobacteraceae bacterium]|jgi:uncharacterized damage-inducible protein DinB|nr:DinB family protein [Bryobacteraceae bacterium]
MDAASRIFIDYSVRQLQVLAGRIDVCLGRLSEEQVWMRGGENENAAGNLVLHLCGNVRQWIVSGVGGASDTRHRDAEFAAREGASIAGLKEKLVAAVSDAVGTLQATSDERLLERITVQQREYTVLEAVYHVVEHFAMHTGQIIFATKMLTGDDLGFYAHLRTARANDSKSV